MKEKNSEVSHFGDNIVKRVKNSEFLGRMNDPTASSCLRGICGDEMEFYIVIKDGIIENVRFYTDGCMATLACGEITASLVMGKAVEEALRVSPKEVMEKLGELPADHRHCAILAVSALYKAIADYLMKD